jgi:putative FmdB family regulatory protein
MPIYEYRCKNGHTFEVMQSMSDDPVTKCEVCGAPVERVFHPIAVHFKGSGFYTTDYGRKRSAAASESESSSKESSSKDSSSKEAGDSGKTATKSESSSSSGGSGSGNSGSGD